MRCQTWGTDDSRYQLEDMHGYVFERNRSNVIHLGHNYQSCLLKTQFCTPYGENARSVISVSGIQFSTSCYLKTHLIQIPL